MSTAPALFASSTVFAVNQLLVFAMGTDLMAATGVHAAESYAPVLVHMTSLLLGTLFFRIMHRQSARSVRPMSAFAISSATCAVEEHRAVVQRKIAVMVQATGKTEDTDTRSLVVFITFLGNGFNFLGSDSAAGKTLCSSACFTGCL